MGRGLWLQPWFATAAGVQVVCFFGQGLFQLPGKFRDVMHACVVVLTKQCCSLLPLWRDALYSWSVDAVAFDPGVGALSLYATVSMERRLFPIYTFAGHTGWRLSGWVAVYIA